MCIYKYIYSSNSRSSSSSSSSSSTSTSSSSSSTSSSSSVIRKVTFLDSSLLFINVYDLYILQKIIVKTISSF